MALPTIPLRRRYASIGAALETTMGTSVLSSVTAPLAGIISNIESGPDPFVAADERRPDLAGGGTIVSTRGPQTGYARCDMELRHGDGWATLIQACGWRNSTGTTYVPYTTGAHWKSLSVKHWLDGTMNPLVGAMGTWRMRAAAAMKAMMSFELRGKWGESDADTTPVADVALPAQTPVTAVTKYLTAATTITLGGAAVPLAGTVEIDSGFAVAMRESIASAAGVAHAVPDDAAWVSPKITLDFERHLVADFAMYSKHAQASAEELIFALNDGTNTLTFTAPKAQIVNIVPGERAGRAVAAVTFQCCVSSGGDALTIVAA